MSSCCARGFSLSVERLQIGDRLTLRRTQLHLCLVTLQLSLFYPALNRAPVPHRNVERGRGRITQIADAIGADGKMVRVNTVEVIEHQRRQMSRTRDRDFVVGDFE